MRAFIKPVLFIILLIPLVFQIVGVANSTLGFNPIETVVRNTGDWALRILLITLTISPLRKITGWNSLVNFRRMLGLFAFFYVCIHLSLYISLEKFFDISEIIDDVIKRPYITAGFSAFIILILLAGTSTTKMIARLQHRWILLHRLVYIAAMLAVLHFWWMVKIDTREPAIYAIILAVLLGFRFYYYARRKLQS